MHLASGAWCAGLTPERRAVIRWVRGVHGAGMLSVGDNLQFVTVPEDVSVEARGLSQFGGNPVMDRIWTVEPDGGKVAQNGLPAAFRQVHGERKQNKTAVRHEPDGWGKLALSLSLRPRCGWGGRGFAHAVFL